MTRPENAFPVAAAKARSGVLITLLFVLKTLAGIGERN